MRRKRRPHLPYQARNLDLQEPKYPSNLSAALYEAGKYVEALKSVRDAWKRLHASSTGTSVSATDPLAIKLATRLAKAKINGVRSGFISLHASTSVKFSDQERAGDVLDEEVEKFGMQDSSIGAEDPKISEMKAVWRQWSAIRSQCTSHSQQECEAQKDSAEVRFRAIRIFKAAS